MRGRFGRYNLRYTEGVYFQKVFAEIKLADGIARHEVVYSTIVDIIIGKRYKRIRFISLSKAETLLGIDFLEQAGIVMDLAQPTWHFKDDPNTIFEFKMQSTQLSNQISLTEANIQNKKGSKVMENFMSWFEKENAADTNT